LAPARKDLKRFSLPAQNPSCFQPLTGTEGCVPLAEDLLGTKQGESGMPAQGAETPEFEVAKYVCPNSKLLMPLMAPRPLAFVP
jgi:hypothetical protein